MNIILHFKIPTSRLKNHCILKKNKNKEKAVTNAK